MLTSFVPVTMSAPAVVTAGLLIVMLRVVSLWCSSVSSKSREATWPSGGGIHATLPKRSMGIPDLRYYSQPAYGYAQLKMLLYALDPYCIEPMGNEVDWAIDLLYRNYRLKYGLTEPQAIEAIERFDELGTSASIRTTLREACLLDEWPVGWNEDEWPGLAMWLTFKDTEYWLGRLLDTSDTNRLLAPLLAAQGHLAPLLRAVGDAIHIIPESPRFSAGKSRAGEIIVYVGGGQWLASATVAALKDARKNGPVLIGIDEGDEAERDNPGIKAYLLASHDWEAVYRKFSDPDEKGRRESAVIPYGGPVVITFRKKPWGPVASRAHVMEMEPSKRYEVSDDGDGQGFKRLLGPVRIWVRVKCEEALRGKDELWALRRTHESDFIRRLNKVTQTVSILRLRGRARSVLLTAELLGLNVDEVEVRLTEALGAAELESENVVIIEAIEADPFYRMAKEMDDGVEVEALRLRVQKYLADHKESANVTRNRFAAVLGEMGYSKKMGLNWKRDRAGGRDVWVIFPAHIPKGDAQHSAGGAGVESDPGAPGGPATHTEDGGTGGTG